MNQIKQHEQLYWYIGIIVFYFIMAILTPLSFVDWHWYLNSHLSSLSHDLMQNNGRYLGSFLEIIAMCLFLVPFKMPLHLWGPLGVVT